MLYYKLFCYIILLLISVIAIILSSLVLSKKNETEYYQNISEFFSTLRNKLSLAGLTNSEVARGDLQPWGPVAEWGATWTRN